MSLPALVTLDTEALEVPRHSLLVRITHWIVSLGFFGLLVSGIAILLAHPRLYWGETGGVGTPSLLDLPLPFIVVGQTGWGRHLHFLSAWTCVLAGIAYVFSGLYTGHFRKDLLPAPGSLTWSSPTNTARGHLLPRSKERPSESDSEYNVLQRMAYLAVIFVLFPLAIWTGLGMSPAITSVFPWAVTIFGGQQSARTIHFLVACLAVVFVVAHVTMVCLSGFTARMRSMFTGRSNPRRRPT